MEKEVAISILEDIENSLNSENWKEKSLKTIEMYRKNLELSVNPKLKKMVAKQKEYVKKYGENDKKTLNIGKKIDEEIRKIFNS